MSDRELVDALRLHDGAAAEHLVASYADRAYRLASRITRDARDAEEVVQDALWAIVRKIDTFRGDSAFGSWLYRIVANAAYQKTRVRQGQRRELSLDELLPLFDDRGRYAERIADWSAAVDEPHAQADLREALDSAIGELRADHRAVFVLHDIEGRSNLEIAEALDLSVANVKSRLHRARLFLRKRLAAFMTRPPGRRSTAVGAEAAA
jgi:RNA polymerase sigma-70 factor (ECF subfamily)